MALSSSSSSSPSSSSSAVPSSLAPPPPPAAETHSLRRRSAPAAPGAAPATTKRRRTVTRAAASPTDALQPPPPSPAPALPVPPTPRAAQPVRRPRAARERKAAVAASRSVAPAGAGGDASLPSLAALAAAASPGSEAAWFVPVARGAPPPTPPDPALNAFRTEPVDADGATRTLSSAYSCAICRETMYDAAQTPCGHAFCAACLDRALERQPPRCPSCNAAVALAPPSRGWTKSTFMVGLFDDLRVRCPLDVGAAHAGQGGGPPPAPPPACGWLGAHARKDAHALECGAVRERCVCGVVGYRAHRAAHALVCASRQELCRACGAVCLAARRRAHARECPAAACACDGTAAGRRLGPAPPPAAAAAAPLAAQSSSAPAPPADAAFSASSTSSASLSSSSSSSAAAAAASLEMRGCGATLRADAMAAHVRQHCPQRVVQCAHGCAAPLRAAEQEAHERKLPRTHLRWASAELARVRRELAEAKSQAPPPRMSATGNLIALFETHALYYDAGAAAGAGADALGPARRWLTRALNDAPAWRANRAMAALGVGVGGGGGDLGHSYLVVCGGTSLDTGEPSAAVDRYDLASGHCVALAPMRQARDAPLVLAHTHLVVALGGDAAAARATCERLDLRAGEWAAMPAIPLAHGAPLCGGVVDGGRRLVVAGQTRRATPLAAYVWEADAQEWRRAAALARAPGGAMAAVTLADARTVVVFALRAGERDSSSDESSEDSDDDAGRATALHLRLSGDDRYAVWHDHTTLSGARLGRELRCAKRLADGRVLVLTDTACLEFGAAALGDLAAKLARGARGDMAPLTCAAYTALPDGAVYA